MTRTLPTRFDLTFASTGEVVVDIEALIGGVLGVEGWPAYLEPADEAELRATLLGDAVLLERKYVARDGIEARPWLFQRLRFKARDWRRVYTRHGGREDELDDLGGDPGSHFAPEEAPGDRGHAGRDALRELLEGGDRPLLREIEALGLGPPPGARGRNPGAREWLDRLDADRRARVARLGSLEQGVAA